MADFDAKNYQNWDNWSKTQIAKPRGKNESKLVKIGKKLVSVKANLKKPNSFQHPVQSNSKSI